MEENWDHTVACTPIKTLHFPKFKVKIEKLVEKNEKKKISAGKKWWIAIKYLMVKIQVTVLHPTHLKMIVEDYVGIEMDFIGS